jgi:drug/metabolite transporter (DMT)-like permease
MHVALLTAIAMLAFAGNSLLCRMALEGEASIDPTSYTSVRLFSGALVLALLVRLRGTPVGRRAHGSWRSAAWLFLYAIACSYAYVTLDTGVGALILFGAVQATMIGAGMLKGERPDGWQWLGIVAALGGLAYLLSPGLTAPSWEGTVLMAGAGIAWGLYSLRGKGARDPLAATADNFLRSLPMAGLLLLILFADLHVRLEGVLLAVLSGAVTSGVGYAIWYAAVRGLSAASAAVVQLSAPVLATYAGVMWLDEALTGRIIIASITILGGIALATRRRPRVPAPDPAASPAALPAGKDRRH